jgi:hypothetical protein
LPRKLPFLKTLSGKEMSEHSSRRPTHSDLRYGTSTELPPRRRDNRPVRRRRAPTIIIYGGEFITTSQYTAHSNIGEILRPPSRTPLA